MLVKACARPGCTAPTDGKYCSRRCSALARIGMGWKPHTVLMRPEIRAIACRKGQAATTRVKRRQRAKAILDRLRPLLNGPCFQGMEPEHRAAMAATLAKAFRIGKAVGYQEGYHAKETPKLKRTKKSEAA